MKLTVTDPTEVEALYRAHYRGLFRLAAVFLDDKSAADDVVQEAFVRLHSARTGPTAGRELAWLRQVVVNGCRERFRRRKTAERNMPNTSGHEQGADETVATAEMHRRIAAAVDASGSASSSITSNG
jgi:DNA-directed RNA polymerase specialized sigma24 family protein